MKRNTFSRHFRGSAPRPRPAGPVMVRVGDQTFITRELTLDEAAAALKKYNELAKMFAGAEQNTAAALQGLEGLREIIALCQTIYGGVRNNVQMEEIMRYFADKIHGVLGPDF